MCLSLFNRHYIEYNILEGVHTAAAAAKYAFIPDVNNSVTNNNAHSYTFDDDDDNDEIVNGNKEHRRENDKVERRSVNKQASRQAAVKLRTIEYHCDDFIIRKSALD